MITYPGENETFTIDNFRVSDGLHIATYYVHVVNNKTKACKRLFYDSNFETVKQKYEELRKECSEGWHIEITVGIRQEEVRARIM